jgi:hypothetical protein
MRARSILSNLLLAGCGQRQLVDIPGRWSEVSVPGRLACGVVTCTLDEQGGASCMAHEEVDRPSPSAKKPARSVDAFRATLGPMRTSMVLVPLLVAPSCQDLERSLPLLESVSVGSSQICGLDAQGDAHCWFPDAAGMVVRRDQLWVASDVPSEPFTEVALGGGTGCGIQAVDGSLRCWGPFELEEPGPYVQVTAGLDTGRICALRETDGEAECWATSEYYVFGGIAEGPFSFIDLGSDVACGLSSDARLRCWGQSHSGLAGPYSQRHTLPELAYRSFSVGDDIGLAIDTEGGLHCWGSKDQCEELELSGTWSAASVGDAEGCALRSDGRLACFGTHLLDLEPELIEGPWASVSTGGSHNDGSTTCLLDLDGYPTCFAREG